MNRTIALSTMTISLALAAGAAQAQQVTVYGRANVDFEKTSLSGTPAADAFGGNQRLSSNSSRFGVRAAKEFEGLKVFAQMEAGVSWDAGGDTLAGRDTFVGVEGGFGKVRLGKMDTPMKDLGGYTDRFKGTGIQDDGSIALLGGSANGFSRRQNNSVRYDSPSLGGFEAAVQYGLDTEDKPSSEQKKLLSLYGQYRLQRFKAALAYEQHRNFNNPGLKDDAWRIAAFYDFGFANVGVGANRISYDLPVGDVRRSYAAVSVGVPVGKGAFNFRFGRAGSASGSAPDGATLFRGPESGARQYTVGYEHDIFKGAQFYAYWTRIVNQANANYRFGVNAINLPAADRGADPSGIAVGMLYDF
jgi:predicted porin